MLRVLRLEAVQASQLGDGVDAPRRHQRAKVTVSNCHLKEAVDGARYHDRKKFTKNSLKPRHTDTAINLLLDERFGSDCC